MRMFVVTLGLAGLVLAPACKKEEKKAETAPEPAAEMAPEGEPGAAGEPGAGEEPGAAAGEAPTMANKMANCPSAVPDSETKVEEGKGNVVVTVTAKEPAKVAEIQKRAEHLDKVEAAPDVEVKHTGEGTGGGMLGKCPVVMADVTIEVAKQDDGVKVTLTPKDAAKVGELAQTAKDRVARMGESGMGAGTGGGAGEEPGEDEEPAEEP